MNERWQEPFGTIANALCVRDSLHLAGKQIGRLSITWRVARIVKSEQIEFRLKMHKNENLYDAD